MSPNEFELSSSLKHLPTGSKISTEYIKKARVEPIAKYRVLRFPEFFSIGVVPESASWDNPSISQWSLESCIGLTVEPLVNLYPLRGSFNEDYPKSSARLLLNYMGSNSQGFNGRLTKGLP